MKTLVFIHSWCLFVYHNVSFSVSLCMKCDVWVQANHSVHVIFSTNLDFWFHVRHFKEEVVVTGQILRNDCLTVNSSILAWWVTGIPEGPSMRKWLYICWKGTGKQLSMGISFNLDSICSTIKCSVLWKGSWYYYYYYQMRHLWYSCSGQIYMRLDKNTGAPWVLLRC